MRLTALVAVLLLTAGNALACPMHEQTAGNDQTVAQNGGAAKKLPQSQPGNRG